MFSNGSYATIWANEDKGNYSVLEMTTSKKDKESGEYKTDFSSKFVRFVGQAHNKAKKYKLDRQSRIKIESCGVTVEPGNNNKWYTNFVVFDFSLPESNNKSADDGGYDGDYNEDDELPV